MTDAQLLKAAQLSLTGGSKSFAAAARFLPRDVRDYTTLLYAWCRHCDDVVDGQTGGRYAGPVDDAAARVSALRSKTESALSGRPSGMPFTALAKVVSDRRLNVKYVFDHLSGYQMDADMRRFQRLEDTIEYSYHVAGTVGKMMAQIMGVRDFNHLKYASDLGIAFQLTNISRDVIEDAEAGRCYLPATWLDAAGLTVQDLRDVKKLRLSHGLAKELVDHADPYYESARSGLSLLPRNCHLGILSALEIYRDIGRKVHQASPSQWSARLAISRGRKLQLIVRCLKHRLSLNGPRSDLSDRTALWTPRNAD